MLSPQGFGPARNIVAFTDGDVACRADFYAEAVREVGLLNVKLGNCGRFARTPEELETLLTTECPKTDLGRLASGGIWSKMLWLVPARGGGGPDEQET